MMKKILLLTIFIIILPITNLYSHIGRTNSEGCHNNRKTGDYHCHNTSIKKQNNKTSSKKYKYNRKEWNYSSNKSPFKDDKTGYYTNIKALKTDIDHIVALHDANQSGGYNWSNKQKELFANDSENQVPALEYVNRTLKNYYTPKKFIQKMKNNLKYNFAEKKLCSYVNKYIQIKKKYNLNFENNNKTFLNKTNSSCSLPYQF